MAENVARTVDARALAVPDGKDAVMLALAKQFRLLRAPAGGGGQLLVQAGLEHDVGGGELIPGFPELLVEAAEGRAAVSGNETGCVQSCKPVALALHEQHADDRLRTRDIDTFFRKVVFVVERDVVQGHSAISST